VRRLALAIGLLAGLVACGGEAANQAPRTAAADPCAEAPVDLPPTAARPRPLVLAFHGLGMPPGAMRPVTGLGAAAGARGMLVAYPAAADGRRWELDRRDGDEDIERTRALIDGLVASGCADPRRIYATGLSNGAGFAGRVACDLAGRVAAVAPVAGSFRVVDPCPRRRPRVAVLEIHGKADPFGRWADRLIRPARIRNGCRRRPRVTRRRGVTRRRWRGCGVEQVTLARTGHVWPAGAPTPYEATAAMLAFFARRPPRAE